MPVSDFLQITEKIKTQYNPDDIMVVITGGEPLMRKDLESCGHRINKAGISLGNGNKRCTSNQSAFK